MRSVQYKVRSAERTVKYGVWSAECGVESVGCGVWSVKWGVWFYLTKEVLERISVDLTPPDEVTVSECRIYEKLWF